MEELTRNIVALAGEFGVEIDLLRFLETLPDESLIAFAETQDDPDDCSDVQTYIFVHLLVFFKTGSSLHLEKAIIQTEGWASITSDITQSHVIVSFLDALAKIKEKKPWRSRCAVKEARILIPDDHEDVALADGLDGQCHELRYELTRNTDDLDRAIEYIWKAVNGVPQGHYYNVGFLAHFVLSKIFRKGCKRTGETAHLEKMIEATNIVHQFLPPDAPSRSRLLNQLSCSFKEFFDSTNSIKSLDKAVALATENLQITSEDDPEILVYTSNLINSLISRSRRISSLPDLNKAIGLAEKSLSGIFATSQSSFRLEMMVTLSSCLTQRYTQINGLQDLDRAIELMEVLAATEISGDPIYLYHFSSALTFRFDRSKNLKDIDKAINLSKIAIGVKNLPVLHKALSDALRRRAGYKKDISDFSEAIEACKKAVDIALPSDPDLPGLLHTLGDLYGHRYDQSDDVADLNQAVRLTSLSVDALPPGDTLYTVALCDLSKLLRLRFRKNHSQEDLDRAKSLFQQFMGQNTYQTPGRVIFAVADAIAPDQGLPAEERYKYLEKSVQLITQASPMSMQQRDQQHMMSKFARLPSEAAGSAMDAGKGVFHALSLLEQGRGVMTDHLMKLRTDISGLEESHPKLVAQFVALRHQLDAPDEQVAAAHNPSATGVLSFGGISIASSSGNQRVEAEKAFHKLCEKIRKLPGFATFLLPLTAEEAMEAADPDPIVIINMSSTRCDAATEA
ncbi:hypothetical protein AA313_de0202214 [Arthrobotrys entomopaga]|nr:hypothetical protein AA313_de0202214 [Arthrobotrys entomopaga]